MANQEHIDLLRQRQWNQWRGQHPGVEPDLESADLSDTDLEFVRLAGANLNYANLSGANLRGVDLSLADLIQSNLSGADLIFANLSGANLSGASMEFTILPGADLSGADLSEAYLIAANLSGADLNRANLSGAKLSEVKLSEVKLNNVMFAETSIAKLDLRTAKGLTTIRHGSPSHIELFSVQFPQDGSVLHFLRGVGVPDEWINFYQATMMHHPIQYHSCFISYSSKDETLAYRLHSDLQACGVRCWFAPEDLKIGNKFRQRIDEAIHLQDKLLLLLSEHSIASTWVESEVESALEKEDRQQREVLLPVRLDDVVMQTSKAQAATLRRIRHIGNFANWTDPQAYQSAFDLLLRDLK